MFKKPYSSYAENKIKRHRIFWTLAWVSAFFFLYLALSALVLFTRRLETNAMQPALHSGDHIVFVSRIIYQFLPDDFGAARLDRGDIVLVDTGQGKKRGLVQMLLDTAARFFSAQQIGFAGHGGGTYVKRIIGFPGDEISIINFVIRVKPAGSVYGFTEFELADRPYTPNIPQIPALWDDSLPFSGGMDPIVLGEDECFVISDDRSNTNDSRTWGPVPLDYIAGRALFRYWPLSRIGRP
jgi:signal peptidase I